MTRSGVRTALIAAAGLAALLAMPGLARGAGGAAPAALASAVRTMAPDALPVPGGWRFRIQDVVVSVLADEASGLLRVVARAGDLPDREVGLVVSALGPDLPPDLGPRVVSVRGMLCAAVLAPLRGLTEAVLRGAVEGAVRGAREAVAEPDPFGGSATAGSGSSRLDGGLAPGAEIQPEQGAAQ